MVIKSASNYPPKRLKIIYSNTEYRLKEISGLEKEKELLEIKMNNGSVDFEKLQQAAQRVSDIIALLDKKEMRWLELIERG